MKTKPVKSGCASRPTVREGDLWRRLLARKSLPVKRSTMRSILLLCSLLLIPELLAAQNMISWSTIGRAYRESAGSPVLLQCPPGRPTGPIWGTGVYTDDSSVCTAAVHAGVINLQSGGRIILRMRPGQNSYLGTTRNGVTSAAWDRWDHSFSVERAPAPQPEEPMIVIQLAKPLLQPASPSEPAVITWHSTASDLAPNGRQFTFRCVGPGTLSIVKGRNPYSWDSSICTAAVHAGAITAERGGIVTIEMQPGYRSYVGAERNGVVSMQGVHTTLGFIVVLPNHERR